MNKSFDEDALRERYGQTNPKSVIAGRWCSDEGYSDKGSGSEDAAGLAVFLASEDSANMTGQDINTGGTVMW